MPPISLLPLLLLLLAGAAAAAAPAEPPTPTPTPAPGRNKTIYELLPLFGLPPGVFPANVTAFSLAGNGSLAVDLAGPCYVHFEYLTYFEPRVTGVLRYGSLTQLEGVQVRRFLVWFSVVRVKVDLPPPPRRLPRHRLDHPQAARRRLPVRPRLRGRQAEEAVPPLLRARRRRRLVPGLVCPILGDAEGLTLWQHHTSLPHPKGIEALHSHLLIVTHGVCLPVLDAAV
uniref:Uncharacterized protein n=1 Tax=Triticum urartu TaxID=4572 RepID=A0A8R7PBB0_TRIUA